MTGFPFASESVVIPRPGMTIVPPSERGSINAEHAGLY